MKRPPGILKTRAHRQSSSKRRSRVSQERIKKCARCNYFYPPDAFDADRGRTDGRQSYCKQCKDEWEATPEGIHSRLREYLQKHEPEVAHLWTAEAFNDKWQQSGGVCTYCKGGLREWQTKGLTLDRVDSKDRCHSPANTVLCCWPCNWTKSSMEYFAWIHLLESLQQKFSHCGGVIQWGSVDSRFKRAFRRKTQHLRVQAPQLRWAL